MVPWSLFHEQWSSGMWEYRRLYYKYWPLILILHWWILKQLLHAGCPSHCNMSASDSGGSCILCRKVVTTPFWRRWTSMDMFRKKWCVLPYWNFEYDHIPHVGTSGAVTCGMQQKGAGDASPRGRSPCDGLGIHGRSGCSNFDGTNQRNKCIQGVSLGG